MNMSRGPAAAPEDLRCADGQPISLLPDGPADVITGPLAEYVSILICVFFCLMTSKCHSCCCTV